MESTWFGPGEPCGETHISWSWVQFPALLLASSVAVGTWSDLLSSCVLSCRMGLWVPACLGSGGDRPSAGITPHRSQLPQMPPFCDKGTQIF